MSTTQDTQADESEKAQAEREQMRDEVELEFYAEKALAELPDHFEEHSRYHISGGEQILSLIPEGREDSGILLHGNTAREVLHDLGFEEGSVFETNNGAGVKFRFRLERD